MIKNSSIAALSLAIAFSAQTAYAQTPGFFIGAALGHTNLDSPTAYNFEKASSPLRTLLGGYAWKQDFRVEGRLSYLHESQTEHVLAGQIPEAPLRVRLNAFLVEANAGWSPRALRIGRLQPVASAGVVISHAIEARQSDTPEENSLQIEEGAVGSIGLEAYLKPRIALTGRVSYRSIGEPVKVPADGLGIRGASWEIGLRVTP